MFHWVLDTLLVSVLLKKLEPFPGLDVDMKGV